MRKLESHRVKFQWTKRVGKKYQGLIKIIVSESVFYNKMAFDLVLRCFLRR